MPPHTRQVDEPRVTVPPRPGRLRAVSRGRDGLDDVLDEVLGPVPDGGPGVTDALLLAAGAAALLAVPLAGAPPVAGVAGAALVLLGLALPARGLLQRRRGRGVVLAASDPDVGRLVTAHDRVADLVAAEPSDLAREALSTAHLAVVEVAALLGGRPPAGPDERAYCTARSSALERLAEALVREGATHEARHRELVARVVRELEETSGQSAPARLEELRRALVEDP